ncbi:MAG: hypothetical protein U1E17_04415 [Geminicoccaceae bacterium]
MAMLVGAGAEKRSRKPLFLAGFLVLPLRGVFYTFSDNPYWLVAVQCLDGVGAGMFERLPDRGRSHPRHRPVQRQPGCDHHRPGHRCSTQHLLPA